MTQRFTTTLMSPCSMTVEYLLDPPIDCVGVGSYSSTGRRQKYVAHYLKVTFDRGGRPRVSYSNQRGTTFISDDPVFGNVPETVVMQARLAWQSAGGQRVAGDQ